MDDKILNAMKVGITMFFTLINKNLACIYVLFGLNIVDYFTGLWAAPYRNEKRNSDKGRRGIVKKICILLLVAIGAVVDYIAMYASASIGIDFPLKFVIANATAIWLCCNEILSIIENMRDIGVNIPQFLLKATNLIKSKTEKKAEISDESTDDEILFVDTEDEKK